MSVLVTVVVIDSNFVVNLGGPTLQKLKGPENTRSQEEEAADLDNAIWQVLEARGYELRP